MNYSEQVTYTKDHKRLAKHLWPLIVDVATSEAGEGVIGYKELAEQAHAKNPSVNLAYHHTQKKEGDTLIDYPLGVIQKYCIDHNLPLLTALVINVNDGCPGGEFAWEHIGYDDSMENDIPAWVDLWEKAIEKVFAHNWDSAPPNF